MPQRREPEPERYAVLIGEELDRAAVNHRSTVRHRLRVMLEGAGWQRLTDNNRRRIAGAFRGAGIYTDTDLTDRSLDREHWVTLSRTPFPVRSLGLGFPAEHDLQRFLKTHHAEAFAGTRKLEGLRLERHEFRVEYDGERFIDLLFEDEDGTLVAFELEKGDPQPNSVTQLRQYLRGLKPHGEKRRGVLITGRPKSAQLEEDTLDALEVLRKEFDVDWYWYNVDLNLTPLV